jgi:hypothetical protein
MHEPVRNDDGRTPTGIQNSLNYGASNPRFACANLVGEHDTARRQALGHPHERGLLAMI